MNYTCESCQKEFKRKKNFTNHIEVCLAYKLYCKEKEIITLQNELQMEKSKASSYSSYSRYSFFDSMFDSMLNSKKENCEPFQSLFEGYETYVLFGPIESTILLFKMCIFIFT